MHSTELVSEPPQRSRAAFPSLLIRADGFAAQGAFAQAQAEFLEPDPAVVRSLQQALEQSGLGVVAHFYMDAELQGALSACSWPHVHIADSLQMADRALSMAKAGARAIIVLGVDFMAENVRAMLDAGGFASVPVYRVAEGPIGCSLAESAEALSYAAYLERGARTPRSLHIVYVNTSLRVKAHAQRWMPTITCTSSNVVPLMLQAFAQVPDLHVWFGPDTYMGGNLASMLEAFAGMPPTAAKALHTLHTPASLASARERFHWFEQGVCIVHHMFGESVVRRVQAEYPDALIAAHLEVPGEMFALGFRAQQAGRGVVGSTSNILDFIARKVAEASATEQPEPLQIVLGTEAGMTTAIARKVQAQLRARAAEGKPPLTVEIVFPVASEAIAQTDDAELPIMPGVLGGEGCSTAGGCATCPYMKLNSLDTLMSLIERIGRIGSDPTRLKLAGFEPRVYRETIDGLSIAELGTRSIVWMRDFHATGKLPDSLVSELERPR